MPIKMESVVTNLPEIKSEIKAEDFCVTADTSSVAVSTSSSTIFMRHKMKETKQ